MIDIGAYCLRSSARYISRYVSIYIEIYIEIHRDTHGKVLIPRVTKYIVGTVTLAYNACGNRSEYLINRVRGCRFGL